MVMSNHSYLSVNQVNIFNFQEPDCFFLFSNDVSECEIWCGLFFLSLTWFILSLQTSVKRRQQYLVITGGRMKDLTLAWILALFCCLYWNTCVSEQRKG